MELESFLFSKRFRHSVVGGGGKGTFFFKSTDIGVVAEDKVNKA